ncbi:MAG TPA: hypothetical protein VLW53_12280 [Candidatus Eisenbacteria bacterium]|nr:hypothetical protein [Candidatus Eisenbacteria bacterium]
MATHERDEIAGWFAGRLPDGWFTGAPSVTIDDGQIVVVGTLTEAALPADASAQLRAGAEAGRIGRFREATRPHRIHIAREAEHRFELDVTWGAACGGTTETFTPGGSGRRREGAGGEEARNVMIAARRAAVRHWRRRFGFGGPRAWRRPGWHAWTGDEQSF